MDCDAIREGRIGALYGEADEPTLALVNEHEAACPACRQETADLAALRRGLARWTLFEPRAIPRSARPLIPRWLAVAAVVALAVGGALGLARPELSWGDGGVRLAFGENGRVADGVLAEAARQREEIESLRLTLSRLEQRSVARNAASPSSPPVADVAALVRASEQRQMRAMERGLEAISDRLDTQRRLDFARMSAGLAYLDERSGRDIARTNELMGHVMQVSGRR